MPSLMELMMAQAASQRHQPQSPITAPWARGITPGMFPAQPQENSPSLTSYEPSWRDYIARGLTNLGLPSQTVEGLVGSRGIGPTNKNMGMGLVDFTPAGIPLAVNESQNAANQGDWTGAAINAMAMIPGAKAGTKALEAGANEVRQGIRAYHASPHEFERFDLSKIGTGQGAQNYGNGLYAAESPAVSGRGGAYDREFTAKRMGQADTTPQQEYILRAIGEGKSDLDILQGMARDGIATNFDQAQKALADVHANKANIYEISINAHPDEFLDWDKHHAKQSQRVLAALDEVIAKRHAGMTPEEIAADDWTVRDLAATPEGVEALRAAGIKGIRYKDAGSRGADAAGGTHNYVVFDDKIIDILKKYGLAGLTAGLGGAAAMGGNQPMTPEQFAAYQRQGGA